MGMMKGRTIVVFALVFLAGVFVGGWLTFPPAAYLAAAFLVSGAAFFHRTPAMAASALLLLGATAVQVGRMPPRQGDSALRVMCAGARDRVSGHIATIVPEGDEQAVLKALVIGDRSGLGRGLRDNYRKSGAMHILALSGLHIGIIYKILDFALFFLGGSFFLKRIKSFMILALIWAFALVSGMSPSIARAALMITVYEASAALHSGRDGLVSLAVSALLITLVDPEAPRQVSFQLSFCACLAIFTIYPRLTALMETRSRALRYVWQCVCLALACQIGTGPLSYHYFHTFPRFFMVTNLLAVPLVPAIMCLAAASLAFSGVPVAGRWLVAALCFAVRALNRIVFGISIL